MFHELFESDLDSSNLAKHCTTFQDTPIIGAKDYVGIYQKPDAETPLIYLPHGFPNPNDLSEIQLRKKLTTLIRVIIRSKRELRLKGNDIFQGNDHAEFPFDSFYRVILDYLQYGFLLEPERKERTFGSGRNQWAKTLRKNQPFWTEQGPVHLHPIRIRTVYTQLELMEIQEYCLMLSDRHIGWLFGRRMPLEITWNSVKIMKAIRYVESAKSQTFNERKTNLLRDMEVILKKKFDGTIKKENNFTLGIKDYMAHVWENMVEVVFGAGEDSRNNPRAKWYLEGGSVKDANGDMRLDSIRVDEIASEKICSVIDSKYYIPGKLPATSDINKQITYGEWVNAKTEGIYSKVQNIFIMPKNLVEKDSEYIGYATMGILEDLAKPYHKIHVVYINTYSLMTWYLRKDRSHAERICHKHTQNW